MSINFNEMLRSLVDAANRHEALMDGTTGPVKAILESADVVWAVFNDPMEEGLGISSSRVPSFLKKQLWGVGPAPFAAPRSRPLTEPWRSRRGTYSATAPAILWPPAGRC